MTIKNFYLVVLLVALFGLTIIPSTSSAASASIIAVRTDGMDSHEFDTAMPDLSGARVPRNTTVEYYPAYPASTSYLQLKIQSAGLNYPYLIVEGENKKLPYTIESTTYSGLYRIDLVQIALSDLNVNSTTNDFFTNQIGLTYYGPGTSGWVTGNTMIIRWLKE